MITHAPEKEIKKNWKPIVSIEIVNFCNATCPYCPTGNAKLTAKDYMSPSLFEQIIVHLSKIGILSRDGNNMVMLFNYGDPFLHPDLNSILDILGSYKLRAGFSSNFIKYPDISSTNLDIIGTVIFSLSGMSNRTYGAIHGRNIKTVLSNFEKFINRLNSIHSDTVISAFWHRYRFNEDELDIARDYFKEKNVVFRPCLAYLIDLEKNIEIIERGGIESEEGKQLNNQLFLDEIYKQMASLSGAADRSLFECPQYNILAVNEYGELLTCCGLTRFHVEYKIGDIREMNLDQIIIRKRNASVCKKCLSYGIPHYMQKDVDDLLDLIIESKE